MATLEVGCSLPITRLPSREVERVVSASFPALLSFPLLDVIKIGETRNDRKMS